MIPITGHVLVKNEENYINAAINSILPICERIIVWDTGSNDHTLEWIPKDPKIEIIRKNAYSRKQLVEYREEMRKMTETEYFLVCDGDEIYNTQLLKKELKKIPIFCNRIELPTMTLFPNHAPEFRYFAKIFKTNEVEWGGEYFNEHLRTNTEFEPYSLEGEIAMYHYSKFPRTNQRVSFDFRRKNPIQKIHYFLDKIGGKNA